MITTSFHFCAGCFVSAFLLASVAGCPKEQDPTTSAPIAAGAPAGADAEIQAEAKAKLAKADLLDGKADKTVTRCAQRFGKNMTESVLAMKIPEG